MDWKLHFFYELKLEFSNQVVNHHFRNKIEPRSTLRQRIDSITYEITPCEMLAKNNDGFGNLVVYGSTCMPHERFHIVMKGTATTYSQSKEEKAEGKDVMIQRYPTRFTMPGKQISQYLSRLHTTYGIDPSVASPCNVAEYYMKQLGRDFAYKKGSSSIDTVAEEAMAQRGGVCQDFAHILISLLRMSGIAARYVVGLLMGEGESHAWVEVFQDGYWYGIDPTNQKWVDESYIKLSSGRDYKDCIMSRGIFEGIVKQKQSVYACVTKEGGDCTT